MKKQKGFSLIELLVAMTITLVLLGLASGLLSRALGTRTRESKRTDALTSAQAALNVMSREIANSGYGIYDKDTGKFHENGIVLGGESTDTRIRIRSNFYNEDMKIGTKGEDIIYYYDATTKSIVRYDLTSDPLKTTSESAPSYIINSISNVQFAYYNPYSTATNKWESSPDKNTSRVRVTLTVVAESVQGVPPKDVVISSDITLRNSNVVIRQY